MLYKVILLCVNLLILVRLIEFQQKKAPECCLPPPAPSIWHYSSTEGLHKHLKELATVELSRVGRYELHTSFLVSYEDFSQYGEEIKMTTRNQTQAVFFTKTNPHLLYEWDQPAPVNGVITMKHSLHVFQANQKLDLVLTSCPRIIYATMIVKYLDNN